MSLISNNSAIKRFTYDWLVRFAELHPLKTDEYFNNEYCKLWVLVNNVERRPNDYPLKYATISPMFTTLINRYMPYVLYSDATHINIKNRKIQTGFDNNERDIVMPLHKKLKIVVSKGLNFEYLQPGMTTWLKEIRIVFYGKHFDVGSVLNENGLITPDDLKYLLSICNLDGAFYTYCTLTDPMEFSEICPLIAHCKGVMLNVKNLVYNENVANVLRDNQFCPVSLYLARLDIPDKAVLEMFDYFSELQTLPRSLFFEFTHEKPATLAEAIVDKYKCAGAKFKPLNLSDVPFNQFFLVQEKGGKFAFNHFHKLH